MTQRRIPFSSISSKTALFATIGLTVLLTGILIGLGLSFILAGVLRGNLFIPIILGFIIGIIGPFAVYQLTARTFAETIAPLLNKTENPLRYLMDLYHTGSAGGAILVDKGEVKALTAPMAMNVKGLLIVSHGSAAVLEKAGLPSRVCKIGRHQRDPFESVRAALDLTVQCQEKGATVFTKDGIPLQAMVRIYFRINSGGQEPSLLDMYPVMDESLIRAVYAVPDWRSNTIETGIETFRAIVASRYSYQIFDPAEKLIQTGIRTDLKHLQDELLQRLAEHAIGWGVEIISSSIELKPPPELAQQSSAMGSGQDDNRRIKEFITETGGTPADFAMLQLARAIARTGIVPPSLEKIISRPSPKAN